jgi:hypothetical protein
VSTLYPISFTIKSGSKQKISIEITESDVLEQQITLKTDGQRYTETSQMSYSRFKNISEDSILGLHKAEIVRNISRDIKQDFSTTTIEKDKFLAFVPKLIHPKTVTSLTKQKPIFQSKYGSQTVYSDDLKGEDILIQTKSTQKEFQHQIATQIYHETANSVLICIAGIYTGNTKYTNKQKTSESDLQTAIKNDSLTGFYLLSQQKASIEEIVESLVEYSGSKNIIFSIGFDKFPIKNIQNLYKNSQITTITNRYNSSLSVTTPSKKYIFERRKLPSVPQQKLSNLNPFKSEQSISVNTSPYPETITIQPDSYLPYIFLKCKANDKEMYYVQDILDLAMRSSIHTKYHRSVGTKDVISELSFNTNPIF